MRREDREIQIETEREEDGEWGEKEYSTLLKLCSIASNQIQHPGNSIRLSIVIHTGL